MAELNFDFSKSHKFVASLVLQVSRPPLGPLAERFGGTLLVNIRMVHVKELLVISEAPSRL